MPVPKSNRNANSTRSCRSKTAIWTDLPYKGELQASMLKAIVKKDNKMIMQKTLKSSRNAEWVQCISYKNLAMRLYGLAGTLKSSRNAEWVQCISYKNLAMRLYGLAG
ncbi:hypothetical protein QE152_g14198 [Popillia japonica]|uniref:Uncharacterized protein n=1 Tax=Popillia japonica TaxID=7064 RepID=A0AAW1LA47_POPJA